MTIFLLKYNIVGLAHSIDKKHIQVYNSDKDFHINYMTKKKNVAWKLPKLQD